MSLRTGLNSLKISVAKSTIKPRQPAAAREVCVVLDTSEGAGEEIAHFMDSQFANEL
jgi:hypothetical protein